MATVCVYTGRKINGFKISGQLYFASINIKVQEKGEITAYNRIFYNQNIQIYTKQNKKSWDTAF